MTDNIRWFRELGLGDVESVGGKNASLGEMVQHLSAAGVSVPDGFATTFLNVRGIDNILHAIRLVSLGSNDLTQLTLGLDRDSALVAGSFDERDPAVKSLIAMAIKACLARGNYVGICGQGPSDHPDLAEWLVDQGIESMSPNPDTVVDTSLRLAARP